MTASQFLMLQTQHEIYIFR